MTLGHNWTSLALTGGPLATHGEVWSLSLLYGSLGAPACQHTCEVHALPCSPAEPSAAPGVLSRSLCPGVTTRDKQVSAPSLRLVGPGGGIQREGGPNPNTCV